MERRNTGSSSEAIIFHTVRGLVAAKRSAYVPAGCQQAQLVQLSICLACRHAASAHDTTTHRSGGASRASATSQVAIGYSGGPASRRLTDNGRRTSQSYGFATASSLPTFSPS